MDELLNWAWKNLVGRIDGPLKFRLVLQPVIAIIFAIRDGLNDFREGRVPYFWAIFTELSRRSALIREHGQTLTEVFVVAVLLDLIYQYLILRWLYPVAALFVAFMFAVLSYLLVRGPANRPARRIIHDKNS